MILSLSGTGVSDGIAVGLVHLLSSGELDLPEYHLDADETSAEVDRLNEAASRCEAELSRMESDFGLDRQKSAAELIRAHRLMLQDEMLVGAAARRIKDERINAEWAVDLQAAELRRQFARVEDDYLALRAEDLDQVVRLLQRQLADQPASVLDERVPHQLDETVVLADSLSPAELAALHQRRVAGLVTEHGSIWSHAAIIARSLAIPMVMAVQRSLVLLREGEPVILDSHYGIVLATRDERLHGHYVDKMASAKRKQRALDRYLAAPDRTRDGERFHLFGNAELQPELDRCRELGAAGVGLMRSEFIFARSELPDEEAQYAVYRAAVEALDGRPLTIRTLDAGGDKLPEEFRRVSGPNPALGLRGIRMSLAMREYFRVQLRAILRASAHGPVRILLPMLSRVSEIRQARELVVGCRDELRARGLQVDPEIRVGGMIETPAAAVMAETFAAELDFVSIGTNDLTQYVLAVDRQDELVSHLFDPSSRAVIELLAVIVRGAAQAGRPVQICGELAADPAYATLLLGLGIREFSVPPGSIPAVKAALVRSSARQAGELVADFLSGPGQACVRELLDRLETISAA